ncbi:hypothetical protein F0562_019425, partial [Nyssa sinensis]
MREPRYPLPRVVLFTLKTSPPPARPANGASAARAS